MDWKTFISNIIQHVSWPLALIIAVYLLKRPIFQLLACVQKIRGFGVELEFSEKIQEASERISPEVKREVSPALETQYYMQLSETSPRGTILEAWIDLESSALELLSSLDVEVSNKSPIGIARALKDNIVFDKGVIESFNELRNLRNTAAHAKNLQITPSEALEYAMAASKMASFFRAAAKK